MGESKRVAKFRAERNAIMATGDVDKIIAWSLKRGLSLPSSHEVTVWAVHKAITANVDIDMAIRSKSKAWLLERGLMSEDDGDVP